MAAPTAFGRLLPAQDWEGDDHTPGAGGHYVTCGDTAAGRAVAWATNGRVNKDGSVYRAVSKDPNGIDLKGLAFEIKAVASLGLWTPHGWIWQDASNNLSAGTGLIMSGWYDALPANLRQQAGPVHFSHDMFACYRSGSGAKNVLLYDPLQKDTHAHGRWVPAAAVRAFMESQNYTVGYIVNQPL